MVDQRNKLSRYRPNLSRGGVEGGGVLDFAYQYGKNIKILKLKESLRIYLPLMKV